MPAVSFRRRVPNQGCNMDRTKLDSGVVKRIDQTYGSDRFLITFRPPMLTADVNYWLPATNSVVTLARSSYDQQVSVDVYSLTEPAESGPTAPEIITRTLEWTPTETLHHRGTVTDIDLRTLTIGIFDRLSSPAGIYQSRKIVNMADALALLGRDTCETFEIVRVRVLGAPDTFRLRLAEKETK